jgi:PAS domain S-box-containing protein
MSPALRVLVANGDQGIRRNVAAVLKSGGYEVLEASTRNEALACARQHRPNIVLLDVHLADAHGTEVCRQLKNDPGLEEVFVALFSDEETSGADQLMGAESGADDYILKSISAGELLARIRMLVRLRDTTLALRASEQHCRGLIQILPDAVALMDRHGRLTVGNPQGVSLLGYASADELVSKTLFDLCPLEEHKTLQETIQRILEGGAPQTVELTVARSDGQLLRLDASVAALPGPAGRSTALVSVARGIIRRESAEEKLRDNEELFRQFAEHIGEVFWMTDPSKKRLHYISPAYELIWGRTRESLYQSPLSWVESIHPEDRDRVLAAAQTRQVTGEYDERYRIVRPDGSIRWIRDRAFPVRNDVGKVYRVLGIAEDITALKESEERLAVLAHGFQSTSQPICITDLEDRFTFVNRAFEQIYGYNQAEILGEKPSLLLSPRNPPSLIEDILASTRAGGWQGEVIDVRKDGTEIPIYLSTSQIQDNTGKVIGLMGVAQDILERKQAEERIRLLADALQSAQELVTVANHENRLTFVNGAFLKAYGYTESEVLGQTPEFLYAPSNPRGIGRRIYDGTLTGGWRGELINRRKDGTEFPISLATSEIKTNEGKSLGLLGIAHDISERRRAERLQSALVSLGLRLGAATAPEDAAQTILDVTSDLFGWDAGFVNLYSEADDDRIVWLRTIDTVAGHRAPVAPPSPIPSALMRQVRKEGARLINRDGDALTLDDLERFGDSNRPSAAMMYVPIRSGGRAIGILSIQSYIPGAYHERDLPLLQALADHCGDSLLRIRVTGALEKAQAKYRGIFENATEGIFRTSPGGRLLEANPALARMFGYASPRELMAAVTDTGRQLYVLPRQRVELRRLLEARGAVRGFETQNRCKDGSLIWVRMNARAVRDPAGRTMYYEGTVEDVTERKRAREALENTRRLQQTMLENIPDPAWLKDAEGRFLACNKAMASFYAAGPDEVIGRTIADLDPREAAQFVEEDNQVMKSRKPEIFERVRTDTRGKQQWFEVAKAPAFDEQGQVMGTVGIAREMTEHKRLEGELRLLPRRIIEAQETERQRVARDLHDSVNQILASAQMRLRKVEESGTEFRPSTREILARCRDLLVQALEENRRIAHDMRPSDLDMLGFAVACRNFCQQFQARTNLTVTCRLGRLGQRLAPASELNLFRIVQEAFNNVEKHARARKLRLNLSARGESLLLRIEDDGRGFNPKAPRTGEGRRSGIGLTNIRERAAAMHGSCEVESAPGRGTTITVRVPLSARAGT